jgi:hypothetical protein
VPPTRPKSGGRLPLGLHCACPPYWSVLHIDPMANPQCFSGMTDSKIDANVYFCSGMVGNHRFLSAWLFAMNFFAIEGVSYFLIMSVSPTRLMLTNSSAFFRLSTHLYAFSILKGTFLFLLDSFTLFGAYWGLLLVGEGEAPPISDTADQDISRNIKTSPFDDSTCPTRPHYPPSFGPLYSISVTPTFFSCAFLCYQQ